MRVLLPCTGCAIACVCTRLATDCRYHTCIKGYVERMSGSDEKGVYCNIERKKCAANHNWRSKVYMYRRRWGTDVNLCCPR